MTDAPLHAYNDDDREEFLKRVASGRSVNSVAQDDDMPTRDTIMRWRREKPEFAEALALAYEAQQEYHIDKVMDALDSIRDGDIDPKCATAWLNGVKFTTAQMAPRKYGIQRQQVEHSGSIQQASDEELDKRIADLLANS